MLHQIEKVDIYSNSWGPGDGGWQVAGPGVLTNQALKNGAEKVHFELCGLTYFTTIKSKIIMFLVLVLDTLYVA